MEIIHIALKY